MFVLQKQETPIGWPVQVSVPQEGGHFTKQEFTARFRVLLQDEIDALAAEGDQAFIRGVLAGWERVRDPDGTEVPFNEQALETMCQTPYIRKGIVAAYYEMTAGIGRKN